MTDVNLLERIIVATLDAFANSAKGLARNPLGIIALFIVLIYGFAALTLGVNSTLQTAERLPLVWFLVLFPIVVLFTFAWLVSQHHEKLYAPGDYKSDDGFIEGIKAKARHAEEIKAQQIELKAKLRKMLAAPGVESTEVIQHTDILMEQLSTEIDRATTITVDARNFLKDKTALYSFPIAAFESLGDLTDAVYFELSPNVDAYEYGTSWWLRKQDSGEIVRSARMIICAPPGKRVPDTRTLSEVNIKAGTTLIVERPA